MQLLYQVRSYDNVFQWINSNVYQNATCQVMPAKLFVISEQVLSMSECCNTTGLSNIKYSYTNQE